MIQTVTGPVDPSAVGKVLSHEHLTFGNPGMLGDPASCYQRKPARENELRMLALAQAHGVSLIVDATTFEHGRDPLLMRRISRETGCAVVCCTGFFKDEGDVQAFLKAQSYVSDLGAWLERLFVSEVTEGIGDTGVRAGAIKVASSLNEIRPLERTVMLAAARAQIRCGVPLLTHCDRGTMATAQADLLEDAGVAPGRVILGHMTSNRDLEEVKRLAERGFMVAFDQFGILSIPDIPTDEEKMANLLEVLKAGFEDQVVLSHDCMFDRMGGVSKSKPRYPDMVFTRVVPYLMEHGVDEGTIEKLTRTNLLRVFS